MSARDEDDDDLDEPQPEPVAGPFVRAEVLDPDDARLALEPPRALARSGTGGVLVYAAAAGAAAAVPLPLLDGLLSGLARGSAMRRVAKRRGVRMTREARAVLSRPGLSSPLSTTPARLLRTAVSRALAPIRMVSRAEDAVATFLSAMLLDHYLATSGRRRGAPLGDHEATIVRAAMEAAWAESGLEALRTVPVGIFEVVRHAVTTTAKVDPEGRSMLERFVDSLLDGTADAPGDLMQRLRDHFDGALERSGEPMR